MKLLNLASLSAALFFTLNTMAMGGKPPTAQDLKLLDRSCIVEQITADSSHTLQKGMRVKISAERDDSSESGTEYVIYLKPSESLAALIPLKSVLKSSKKITAGGRSSFGILGHHAGKIEYDLKNNGGQYQAESVIWIPGLGKDTSTLTFSFRDCR